MSTSSVVELMESGVARRTVPDTAMLSRLVESCAELKSRVRQYAGSSTSGSVTVLRMLAQEVVNKIGFLIDFRDRQIDRCSQEGRVAIKKLDDLVKSLVRSISAVKLPEDDSVRRISDILMHYRASELDDDAELAKNFEKIREEYRANPTDGETSVRFGWMLHDCLRAASRRLHNVKLTEFFKKEFEAWNYQGVQECVGESLGRLLQVRIRDLAYAEKFLSGPRDALEYLSSGAFDKAVAAAKRYLESNPGDSTAFDVILNACDKIGTDEACFDMFNVSGQAVKWHPNEAAYQKKFVYAAEKCYWAIFRLVRKDNQKDWARIATNGYVQLIEETLAGFDGLTLVSPGSIPYSKIMSVVTASVDRCCGYACPNCVNG